MAKKAKKTQKTKAEAEEASYRFLGHWMFHCRRGFGRWWWCANNSPDWCVNLFLAQRIFYERVAAELGLSFASWLTIDHAEARIRACQEHPVFAIDPDPLFLRKWIDVWIETNYCRLCRTVFDHLRFSGTTEREAYRRAEQLGAEFEALFTEKTMTYNPDIPPTSDGTDASVDDEGKSLAGFIREPAVVVEPPKQYELIGPHEGRLAAPFKFAYRIIDRSKITSTLADNYLETMNLKNMWYEGYDVVLMIQGNDPDLLEIAAETAFSELRRREVVKSL